MSGGKNKQPLGYTILEVMIVLAISAVMFLIAATFISGKQERTSFSSGINTMATSIQDVIEQVTDGQYSDEPIQCTFNGIKVDPQVSGSQPQGTNTDCVFLGKIMYYDVTDSNSDYYSIIPVAGGRINVSNNEPITSLADSGAAAVTSLSTSEENSQTLNVGKITATVESADGSKTQKNTSSFGFLQTQGSTQQVTGALLSGSQSVNLFAYSGTDNPSNSSLSQSLYAVTYIDMCVTDGTRYADINLGPNSTSGNAGGQLSVNIKDDGTDKCD